MIFGLCVYKDVCMRKCMHIHVCVCAVYMCECMCVCVCVCVCVCRSFHSPAVSQLKLYFLSPLRPCATISMQWSLSFRLKSRTFAPCTPESTAQQSREEQSREEQQEELGN
jgi:hypothetical protein